MLVDFPRYSFRIFGPIVLCLLLASSLPANADIIPVTVTGRGYLGGGTDGTFVNAGYFSAGSAAPDGPSYLARGTVGVPMSLSFSSLTYPGLGFTVVNLGKSFVTDILFGSILFNGTFTVPASALTNLGACGCATFEVPMSVSGDLSAVQDLTFGQYYYTPGPTIASLSFGGTGIATLDLQPSGNQFIIVDATVNFTNRGTLAATVPEPASLLFVATGLSGLALVLKRRRQTLRRNC